MADTGLTIAVLDTGDLDRNHAAQEFSDVESPENEVPRHARIRQFGGSTTAWSGKWLPLTPEDLQGSSWAEDSGWPIRAEDLHPYYARASKIHKGPAPEDYAQWKTAPNTNASNTRLKPVSVYWLDSGQLDFSQTIGKVIAKSETITVFLQCTATNVVLTDDLSRVAYLEAQSKQGQKTTRVVAREYVLASGGIENARLMLASNGQMKNGIGNTYDIVGRYYIDHPGGSVAMVTLNRGKTFPDDFGMALPQNGRHRMDIGSYMTPQTRKDGRFVNSYFVWRAALDVVPTAEIRKLFSTLVLIKHRPSHVKLYAELLCDLFKVQKILAVRYLWFLVSKKAGLRGPDRKFRINYHIEMAPDSENRVTLSDKSDPLGRPLSKVRWKVSEAELQSILKLHDEIQTLLDGTGAGTLSWDAGRPPKTDELPYSSASHHMGTTRMGKDPENSVVDEECQVHGIGNLHIAGSSVFPTGGFSNPTFTIVALAIRLADRLKVKLL
nr:GMC family oxidoreductase [Ruegeria atlantica]